MLSGLHDTELLAVVTEDPSTRQRRSASQTTPHSGTSEGSQTEPSLSRSRISYTYTRSKGSSDGYVRVYVCDVQDGLNKPPMKYQGELAVSALATDLRWYKQAGV